MDKKPPDPAARVRSLERALKRERKARQHAETILENKSRELYLASEDLWKQHERLKRRNLAIEKGQKKLEKALGMLKSSYAKTIKVFARLIQSRAGLSARDSIAFDATQLGRQAGLSETECSNLHKAALLCDIGKLGLADELVTIAYVELNASEQREYNLHPIVAESMLISIDPLVEPAAIIRHHCERVDGSGFPDKISGEDIPLPSKILSVVKAYADLLDGRLLENKATPAEAKAFIESQKERRYDSQVVDMFVSWLSNKNRAKDALPENQNPVKFLKIGAVVSRDVCDRNGVLFLAKGQVLSHTMIRNLIRLQKSFDEELIVYTESA